MQRNVSLTAALAYTNPLVLGIALLVIAISLLAILALGALLIVAIPLLTVWLYSSLTFLLFQHFLDRCRADPRKRRFEAEILEVIDLEMDLPAPDREQEEPLLYGWDFIPAAHDVLFWSTGPAPKPVMVCGVEDGLAVMNGEKLVEDVQFTPLKMPAKNVFSDLTDDELRSLAKNKGCKGITKRMKRDTLIWRISCH